MSRTKYGVFESSNIAATYGTGHIYSVSKSDSVLENGMVVKLGAHVANEREIYAATFPAAGDKVVVIGDPVIIYDQSSTTAQNECYYNIEEGKPCRAYSLIENDEYAVSDDMVTALSTSVVVGNYLVAAATGKYTEVAAAGFSDATYGFVALIEEVINKSEETLILMRVVKNETVAAAAEPVSGE